MTRLSSFLLFLLVSEEKMTKGVAVCSCGDNANSTTVVNLLVTDPSQTSAELVLDYLAPPGEVSILGHDWAVAVQEGEDVDLTQYSSRASELGLIVAHSVESPASVEITAPDQTDGWSELTFKCSPPVSSPRQNIRWEVTDSYYEELEPVTKGTVVEDGQVTSKVSVTLSPSARMVRVKYVAYNEVGYVQDSSQDYLA